MSDREKVVAGLMMLADNKNDNSCEGLKCCKIAEDALALLKEQEQKWISVEDKLPEIRRAVLVYSPRYKNIYAVTMHEDGEWYFWIPTSSEKYDPDWEGPITHWMPLPEIPDD